MALQLNGLLLQVDELREEQALLRRLVAERTPVPSTTLNWMRVKQKLFVITADDVFATIDLADVATAVAAKKWTDDISTVHGFLRHYFEQVRSFSLHKTDYRLRNLERRSRS